MAIRSLSKSLIRFGGLLLLGIAASTAVLRAQTRTLNIYVVDVEGGNATLFVSPSGESLLIDTGNAGAAAVRDAERIAAAAKDAGLRQIDHLITTHWHGDHWGGMAELNKLIPIRHFIDHGPSVQRQPPADEFLANVYPGLTSKAKHTVAKPGDTIPVAGLNVQVLAAAGQVLQRPLAGAGQANPLCSSFRAKDEDPTENAQSVSSLITFGRFRALHLGDLTWNKEKLLACPNNKIGTVDLWVVTHHGQPISNPEVLVHAIHPRVAILNNGTRKGGQPDAMKVIHSSPGLEDLWQIHFSLLSGQEYTVPGMFIANGIDDQQPAMPRDPLVVAQGSEPPPAPVHNGPAHWIKVSAQSDGTFTVTNSRNGFSKTYRAGGR